MRTTSGYLLALAAALALGAFGCQQSTDSESDGDEDVASVSQELDPVDGDQTDDDSEGGLILPGGDAMAGSPYEDPQPQPWMNGPSNGSAKPGPNPVDPSTKTSSVVPSGGHH